jgi:CDP-diacylglycerol--glycerol-3-phosphate 3-phosphatidyltransferase
MNLPNLITVIRIAFVPLFIWLLFIAPEKHSVERWLSVIIFVLAIATDGVDGAIARRKNLVTNLGKLLDPIADKALLGGALVSLSILGELPWWITIVILLRELGITIYRLVVAKHRIIAAAGGGKLKTILQSVAVGFLLSPFDALLPWLVPIEQVLLYAALLVTLTSGIQFIRAELKARNVSN